jgi:hypothetical protein
VQCDRDKVFTSGCIAGTCGGSLYPNQGMAVLPDVLYLRATGNTGLPSCVKDRRHVLLLLTHVPSSALSMYKHAAACRILVAPCCCTDSPVGCASHVVALTQTHSDAWRPQVRCNLVFALDTLLLH